jgi:hypothetical protein
MSLYFELMLFLGIPKRVKISAMTEFRENLHVSIVSANACIVDHGDQSAATVSYESIVFGLYQLRSAMIGFRLDP